MTSNDTPEGAVNQEPQNVDRGPEYEYKTVEFGDEPLEEVLNEHGADGWQFVETVDDDLVFERVKSRSIVRTIAKRDDERSGKSVLDKLRG